MKILFRHWLGHARSIVGWRKRQGHYSDCWYVHAQAWIGRFDFRISRWHEEGRYTAYHVETGWVVDPEYNVTNPTFQWEHTSMTPAYRAWCEEVKARNAEEEGND